MTREIVACSIGERSGESTKALWQSLPAGYRQCAVCYTHFWVSYPVALTIKGHQAVSKASGLTSYIVRVSVAKQNDSTIPSGNACLD